MAIVKMKKIRVMAMASEREELLSQLLRLGCVEISEPNDKLSDPEWAAIVRRGTSRLPESKSEATDVNTALSALKKYAELKDGMFIKRQPITEQEFLGEKTRERAQSASTRIAEQLQELSRLQSEKNRLLTRQAGLLPWKDLDMPLETKDTAHVIFRLGVCPGAADLGVIRTKLEAEETAAELLEVSSSKLQHNLLLICHRADEERTMNLLRTFGFSATAFQGYTGTPAENLDRLAGEITENDRLQQEAEDAIRACADAKEALQIYTDRLAAEVAKDADAERLLTDGTIVFFEGWVPAVSADKLEKLLTERGCAWEAEDPKPEEYPNVPVKLKNNFFTRPLNIVTEMYSLPAYDGVDPNPLMAPFFIFFYGMMMSDMGYGLLMILASVIVGRKFRPKGGSGYLFSLLGLCGISTFLWGIASGSFLGDFIPQIVKIINPDSTFALPSLFTPIGDTMSILIGSLALGFIQVVTGMAVSLVEKAKNGHLLDGILGEGAWWVIIAGAALAIFGIGNVNGVPVVLWIGVAMMVVGASRGAKGFGKIAAVIGAVYNGVTGLFSDVLSYSRLMALMLSGSVIAQVFNTMGAISGNVIVFIIISLLGNTMNFALNLLGCFVHDLRLQCLEFFGKFYKEGGKPFRPLARNTKYVDIEND